MGGWARVAGAVHPPAYGRAPARAAGARDPAGAVDTPSSALPVADSARTSLTRGPRRALAPPLVQRDRARDRDVERLRALERDRRVDVALDSVRQPLALGSEEERDVSPQVDVGERHPSVRREGHPHTA